MLPLAVVVSAAPSDCAALAIALPHWRVVAAVEYEAPDNLHGGAPHVVIINAVDCTADPSDSVLHSTIAQARERFPNVPLLLMVRIGDPSAHTLLKAYCWNIAGVMFRGLDDEPCYAEVAVAEARAVWVSWQLAAALPQRTPGWVALRFRAGRRAWLWTARRANTRALSRALRAGTRQTPLADLPSFSAGSHSHRAMPLCG